jgi:N-methylhydantoinase A
VYFSREEGWVETPVIDRRTFVGTSQGPMILESADCTIAVPPAGIVEGKGNGNLTISLTGEGMKN